MHSEILGIKLIIKAYVYWLGIVQEVGNLVNDTKNVSWMPAREIQP